MSRTLSLHNVNKTCIPFEVLIMSSENIHFCNILSLLKQKHNGTCRNKHEFPSNIMHASHHTQMVPLFSTQLPYDLSPSSLKPTTTRQVILLLQTHHQVFSSIMIFLRIQHLLNGEQGVVKEVVVMTLLKQGNLSVELSYS